ncbi:HEXXH motif domain-containing protein [Streptomyces albicerus]|uniref:HEXXH motif domain-containing protein n=1 Tax=Streptomyces albicerus TaxID=2569859 RepID=UPI00124B48D7|nr:HEXXH motif domain-containing protein [Streptomyces albicerus]
MTSQQRRRPLRMPDRLFSEFAAGGGSAEALAFLERGERARRLLLLRTVLDRIDGLPTPLSPPSDAWHTLKTAATRAPEPVERLLLAPATGGWLAHMLRRLHGTATGPPLWVETGHLCSLAVAAALRAGTETELLVPLTDGALNLPGLGLARLPAARRGFTAGRAGTRAGELTLTSRETDGGITSLDCRPATVPVRVVGVPSAAAAFANGAAPGPAAREVLEPVAADPHWIPLRTLTRVTSSGAVAIPLDDLDPYRDLDEPVPPARLDADEASVWQELFDEAADILARSDGGPAPGRLDPAVIRAVVPWGRTSTTPPVQPGVRGSASTGDAFGAMNISRPDTGLTLAEILVHEFQHSKLAALLHLFPLVEDDREERYYAPWRPDPRHLTGLLHGVYAFTGVAGFWRDRLTEAEHTEAAAYHFALRRTQTRLVVRTLQTSGRLTAPGRRIVAGLARVLDGWLREPVDPVAHARARTAAALHRTEWRLRNVAPPSPSRTGRTADLLRGDRTTWPDLRTHAFATRPRVPRTADEHLAAGDPAAALARYADALARDPGDPHTLAGWIVARAALDPGRATRRMLARPELLQLLPSG